jgi:LemA protein
MNPLLIIIMLAALVVIAARNAAASANSAAATHPGDPVSMKKLAIAEGSLSGSLGRLFALSEA